MSKTLELEKRIKELRIAHAKSFWVSTGNQPISKTDDFWLDMYAMMVIKAQIAEGKKNVQSRN